MIKKNGPDVDCQTRNLVNILALRRQHDNRYTACLTHLCADLIAVHSGAHQIQQD